MIVTCNMSIERFFFGSSLRDLCQDEIRELVIAIFDDNVFDLRCRFFARPGGLPCRAVSVEACAGGCDPVAEALAGVHEITVPSQWCRSVLFWVVGTEPVQV